MKNILIIFLLCMSRVYGQAPAIEWQNTIGGYDYEYFWALQQTSEGGYILGGQSVSDISGDKSEACLGSNDFWIVKLDTAGIIQSVEITLIFYTHFSKLSMKVISHVDIASQKFPVIKQNLQLVFWVFKIIGL